MANEIVQSSRDWLSSPHTSALAWWLPKAVNVSYKDKTAIVTYDDARTDVTTLTRATTEAGYPSALRS